MGSERQCPEVLEGPTSSTTPNRAPRLSTSSWTCF